MAMAKKRFVQEQEVPHPHEAMPAPQQGLHRQAARDSRVGQAFQQDLAEVKGLGYKQLPISV